MKFLINRSDAIGDNILTMPMAQAIKEMFPNAQVAFLTSFICRDIYQNHPYIDKVYYINKKDTYFRKVKKCFQIFSDYQPDYYFYVGGTQTPNFVAWLKGVSFRGGLQSRFGTFFTLNEGIRQKRSQVAEHESFYNIELLSGIEEFSKVRHKSYLPTINLKEDPECISSFNADLVEKGLDTQKKYIVIHPGMTGHTLNWPSENYAELIQRIEFLYPDQYNFIVSYTPSDHKYVEGVRRKLQDYIKIKDLVFFFDGSKKGLRNYMQVLSKADAFIGPSTGTTHIAAVIGIPVIGIYSPIKVQSALRWAPRGSGVIKVVNPDVVCGEDKSCAKEACPYYPCMSKIEVVDIVESFKQIRESK